jgi:hypothetical protein
MTQIKRCEAFTETIDFPFPCTTKDLARRREIVRESVGFERDFEKDNRKKLAWLEEENILSNKALHLY